ncbi:MAG: helix-turn-helix domain-containing protein [Chitinophagales bacterium]
MSVHHQIFHFFYSKQSWLLGLVIACFSLGSAHFYRGGERVHWVWEKHSYVPVILAVIGVYGAILWVKIHEQKLKESFEAKMETQKSALQNKMETLTKRQLEVFTLIAAGKSNKEIASELFIGQSTLKSHINQIYKNLEISNRKQAILLAKELEVKSIDRES